MVRLTFINAVGKEFHVEGKPGENVMLAAVTNGVPGILGECGGSLACCTCHVYLDPEWSARLGKAEGFENDMLDMTAAPRREGSRLCCQIEISDALDGIRLELPAEQI